MQVVVLRIDIWLDTAGETSLTVPEHVASRGLNVAEARWELLTDAIQVSDVNDGAVYLLCPTIADEHGEWEAWLFATWLPGAQRLGSWWELLRAEYEAWRTT